LIPKRILITGASGLVGAALTTQLLKEGHQVAHLGRTRRTGRVPSYVWDVEKGFIENGALDGVDAIIHLAGAGIADKPWTTKRKQEILESRTRSSALLHSYLKDATHQVKVFVSASAIGYYGFGGSDEVFTEESKPGSGFLAEVVKAWEGKVDKIDELNIRTVKVRIGIVLSAEGGALKEIAQPVRWGVGAPLGTGKQFMSWIHIEDLCRMFIHAVENESMHGAYNAVTPTPATNREITKAIARALKRPLLLPTVPGFVLKLMLGEMADLVLYGSKVSSEKIQQSGFTYTYADLDKAISSFYKDK
jgi:uncharacterized protein (TIGR01777 family)